MANTTGTVSVVSRRTVRCASEDAWNQLASPFLLGPLDQLVAPFIPIAVVLVYEGRPDAELIPIERLERAMTLLLDYYPHLTGRLQVNPTDGTTEIASLGAGAELFEGLCTEPLAVFTSLTPGRILLSELPGAGNDLLAPFDGTLEGTCSGPILTVQCTRFVDGGVSLGVRSLHVASDADGFFQLVRDLAELYRGLRSHNLNGSSETPSPMLMHTPSVRSYMWNLMDGQLMAEERRAVVEFQPSLFYVKPTELKAEEAPTKPSPSFIPACTLPPPPAVGRFLRFSSHELSALKMHATNPNGTGWVSTFDALSAHFYQSVYRARLKLRAQDPNQAALSPPDFLTPVNLRTRLGLSPDYFPNALICVYTSLSHEVLATGPLWQVAEALHKLSRTTAITSRDELDQTLRWIALQPNKGSIKQGFRYGNGSLMISQWNKFDLYVGAAFDVPPILVSPPFTPISLIDGLGYFLPTEMQGRPEEEEAGAIDVNLSLSAPLWDILDEDEEFRRFRSVRGWNQDVT